MVSNTQLYPTSLASALYLYPDPSLASAQPPKESIPQVPDSGSTASRKQQRDSSFFGAGQQALSDDQELTVAYQEGAHAQQYAVTGEVQIDTSRASMAKETGEKTRQAQAAALASSDSSAQDLQVVVQAQQMQSDAQREFDQAEAPEQSASAETVALFSQNEYSLQPPELSSEKVLSSSSLWQQDDPMSTEPSSGFFLQEDSVSDPASIAFSVSEIPGSALRRAAKVYQE